MYLNMINSQVVPFLDEEFPRFQSQQIQIEWPVQTSLVGRGWCSSTKKENCYRSIAGVIWTKSDRLESAGRVTPLSLDLTLTLTSFYGTT